MPGSIREPILMSTELAKKHPSSFKEGEGVSEIEPKNTSAFKTLIENIIDSFSLPGKDIKRPEAGNNEFETYLSETEKMYYGLKK